MRDAGHRPHSVTMAAQTLLVQRKICHGKHGAWSTKRYFTGEGEEEEVRSTRPILENQVDIAGQRCLGWELRQPLDTAS